jgi:hypothetical protein
MNLPLRSKTDALSSGLRVKESATTKKPRRPETFGARHIIINIAASNLMHGQD